MLMSNAVKYGKPKSSVYFSLYEEDLHCLITSKNEIDDPENIEYGHGMGLRLLEDQIARADGTLSIEQTENIYTALVNLPLTNSNT
jgi:two-component sensor histidine kinase